MPVPAAQILVAEIVVYGQILAGGSSDKNTVNVFHYRRLATVNPPDKDNLDIAFQAGPMAKVLLALNARWKQLRTSIRWVNDATDAPKEFAHINNGAIATAAMTGNEVVHLKMRTALKGKSFRGSKAFGPLSESDTTLGSDDILNAGALGRFNDIAVAMLVDLATGEGNTWRLCILSRTLSQLLTNATTVIVNDVTSIGVNQAIRDLKRRRVSSVY